MMQQRIAMFFEELDGNDLLTQMIEAAGDMVWVLSPDPTKNEKEEEEVEGQDKKMENQSQLPQNPLSSCLEETSSLLPQDAQAKQSQEQGEEFEGEAWIERMIEDVGKMTWVYDPTPKEQKKKSQQYHHLVIDIPCDLYESCVLLDDDDDNDKEELEGEAWIERMIEDVANMTWVYCPDNNEEAEAEAGEQEDQEEIHLVHPPREGEGEGEEEDETTPQTCAAAEHSQAVLHDFVAAEETAKEQTNQTQQKQMKAPQQKQTKAPQQKTQQQYVEEAMMRRRKGGPEKKQSLGTRIRIFLGLQNKPVSMHGLYDVEEVEKQHLARLELERCERERAAKETQNKDTEKMCAEGGEGAQKKTQQQYVEEVMLRKGMKRRQKMSLGTRIRVSLGLQKKPISMHHGLYDLNEVEKRHLARLQAKEEEGRAAAAERGGVDATNV